MIIIYEGNIWMKGNGDSIELIDDEQPQKT